MGGVCSSLGICESTDDQQTVQQTNKSDGKVDDKVDDKVNADVDDDDDHEDDDEYVWLIRPLTLGCISAASSFGISSIHFFTSLDCFAKKNAFGPRMLYYLA